MYKPPENMPSFILVLYNKYSVCSAWARCVVDSFLSLWTQVSEFSDNSPTLYVLPYSFHFLFETSKEKWKSISKKGKHKLQKISTSQHLRQEKPKEESQGGFVGVFLFIL